MLCNDCSLDSLLHEQYFLARNANISFQDSNNMPDFERQMVLGMLSKDLKEEFGITKNTS